MRTFAGGCFSFLLLCGSLRATIIESVDINWHVTEIATGDTVCDGQMTSSFVGTVCSNVIAGWDGFLWDVLATAAEVPGFVFAESSAILTVAPGLDAAIYAYTAEAMVTASVVSQFVIVGGTGPGVFQGTGSYGGGVSGPSGFTLFGAVSGIALLSCDAVVNPCTENMIPFSFGDPILLSAFTFASVARFEFNGDGQSAALGQGIAGATLGIFDLDGNPIVGATFAYPGEVSEPSYWILSGLVLAVMLRPKTRRSFQFRMWS